MSTAFPNRNHKIARRVAKHPLFGSLFGSRRARRIRALRPDDDAMTANPPARRAGAGFELPAVHDLLLGYGGCALVTLMPVITAGQFLVAPPLLHATLLVAVCGLVTSLTLRSRQPSFSRGGGRILVAACVLTATFGASIWYLQTRGVWEFIVSPQHRQGLVALSTLDAYTVLIHLFIIFLVIRTFSLLTDKDLELSIVPGLSVTMLLCVFEKELVLVPFFVPFALGAMMLLTYSQRRDFERSRETLSPSFANTSVDSTQMLRRANSASARSLSLSLRSLSLITLVSVSLSALLTFVFRGTANRPPLLDQLGIALARRIAEQMIEFSRFPYIAPATTLSLEGGVFTLSPRELFTVEASRPAYWRGSALDTYAGRLWRQSLHQVYRHYYLRSGEAHFTPTDVGIRDGVRTSPFHQVYHLSAPQTGILFGAYEIAAVRDTSHGRRAPVLRFKVDATSSIYCRGTLAPESEYDVISLVKPPPTPEFLASLRRKTNSSAIIPREIAERYLRLPELPSRLERLGKSFTARGKDRPRQVGVAHVIRRYVADHVKYTTAVPRLPPNRDAVDYLLFDSHKGDCTHFASALAVLCRLAGIPSRVIVGFTPGVYDAESGKFRVRELDAHAWTEVFLPDYGWYEMDASPVVDLDAIMGSNRGSPSAGGLEKRLLLWIDAVAGAEKALTMLAALIAAATLSTCVFLIGRQRMRRIAADQSSGYLHSEDTTRRAYRSMCGLLAKKFRPKLRTETPYEYLAAVERWFGASCPHADFLSRVYVASVYGSPETPRPEPQRLRSILRRLRIDLKQQRRRNDQRV